MVIDLTKGQKIDLTKSDGTSLSSVYMGLGWDSASSGWFGGGGSIDLDASAGFYDANKNLIESISFRNLEAKHNGDLYVKHSGDNTTGVGDGDDDETISVKLNRLPVNVTQIVFVVNSWSGQKFGDVKNCYCRLVDKDTEQEIARYQLGDREGGNNKGLIMSKLYLRNGAWKMSAVGLFVPEGKDIASLAQQINTIL